MSFLDRIFGKSSGGEPGPGHGNGSSSPRREGGFGRRTAPPQVPSAWSPAMGQQPQPRPAPPQRAASLQQPYVTPLAAQLITHFHASAPVTGYQVEPAIRPFAEQLLSRHHPAVVACDMVASFHGFVIPPVFRESQSPHVEQCCAGVVRVAHALLAQAGPAPWPVSAAQLGGVIDNYLRIAPLKRIDLNLTTDFLGLVLPRAAQMPELRPKVIELLDALCRSEHNGFINIRRFIDKNMAEAGIARAEVPAMREWDRQAAEISAVRNELLAQAGAALGPALGQVLDGDTSLYRGRAAYTPELKALFSASKEARGQALAFLLSYLVTPRGYDNLGYLARSDGRWAHEYSKPQRPIPLTMRLAVELAKTAMDLPDPDGDHAHLVWLLGNGKDGEKDASRQVLRELVKTVSAHPAGQTVQALRQLTADPAFTGWSADIEAAIHAHVPAAAPASIAPGEARSAPPPLPPLNLPVFEIGSYQDLHNFERHFGNLFEPRLYDAAHDHVLQSLVDIVTAGEALPEGPQRNAQVLQMLRQSALTFNYRGDCDPFRGSYLGCFLDSARNLHANRSALRPLVNANPDLLRKLASLAQQVENKSAPPAKWIKEAQGVIALLPVETWLEQLARQTATNSPTSGMFGPTGEHYIRTLIYLAHLLPAQQAGPLLADYALKQCYVTRKGVGIRCEGWAMPASGRWPRCPMGAGCPISRGSGPAPNIPRSAPGSTNSSTRPLRALAWPAPNWTRSPCRPMALTARAPAGSISTAATHCSKSPGPTPWCAGSIPPVPN